MNFNNSQLKAKEFWVPTDKSFNLIDFFFKSLKFFNIELYLLLFAVIEFIFSQLSLNF